MYVLVKEAMMEVHTRVEYHRDNLLLLLMAKHDSSIAIINIVSADQQLLDDHHP
jgi:hypothetical protein